MKAWLKATTLVAMIGGCGGIKTPSTSPGGQPGGGEAGSQGGQAGQSMGTGGQPAGGGGTGGATGGTGGTGGAGGSGGGAGASAGTGGDMGGSGGSVSVDPHGCSDLFRQDRLPTYEVEISPEEWAKLDYEFLHRAENLAAGLDIHPYHPIVFHYQGETVSNAMIRLKGKSSWRHAAELDDPPKMQFVIAFNEIDPGGEFHDLKKFDLDMPRSDETFLRQRVALAYLRDAGIPAQCANNARLLINGQYYGVFTNLERMNGTFLKRVFPGADDNDLWDAGRALETNELTSDKQRIKLFWAAQNDMSMMPGIIDLDYSVFEWATEAILTNGDGYWGGTHNFFLYDHPTRGFLWLPHDLDSTVDYHPFDRDLVTWWMLPETPGPHYLAVLSSPDGYARYVAALERALGFYDVAKIQKWIDDWSAQIAQAVAEDMMKPLTTKEHLDEVARQRAYIPLRADFARRWLDCAHAPTTATDADADGFPWCQDCNDADATVKPGAGCLL